VVAMQPLKKYMVTFIFMLINTGCNQQVTGSYFLMVDLLAIAKGCCHSTVAFVLASLEYERAGQTTVNKKAPIHYIISINDKVYRPL
ncbi:hypothetical protein, partial [Thiolapillus sp.]|uniref:hypothetical protein n=1 Tax=Thiolapillus sp. TaxID=2017437 RepID=UPI003AF806AA